MKKHWADTTKIHEITSNLVSMGLTTDEVATLLGIGRRQLNRVRKDHPDFDKAVAEGREKLHDILVAEMVRAATGYDYETVRTERAPSGKVLKRTVTTHRTPPNAPLFMFLMANRWPDRWKIQKQLVQKKDVNVKITAEMEGKKIDEFAGKLIKPVESREVVNAQV